MSEPVAPEPTHEIETVERSSIQADTEEKKDEAFAAAMKQKSAEREPVQGHEVPLTRKLTEAEMQHYRSKFREAFPDATPAMMEDVNKVLNQEAHPDADAKLDVVVIDWAIKPPPDKQAAIGNGNKGEPRTEHCASGLGNPCLTSRRMALYLLPYLTFHRLLRDTCLVVKACGTKRKDTCKCTSNFCKHLRKCLHILGGKDDIVAVKLFKLAVIPLLTELIETQRMIIDGDNDEAAFNRYIFGKTFLKKKKTSNKTPHTIFQLGRAGLFILCLFDHRGSGETNLPTILPAIPQQVDHKQRQLPASPETQRLPIQNDLLYTRVLCRNGGAQDLDGSRKRW